MREREARDVLDRIAKMYKADATFRLEFTDSNDDLELTKGLEVYARNDEGYDVWIDIAYQTGGRSPYSRPQQIAMGRPYTCRHALEVLMWCLERRDVGFWRRFGNVSEWTPLFKKGTSLPELKLKLKLAAAGN